MELAISPSLCCPRDSSMRFCTSFVAILSWVLVAFAMGADVESYQDGIGHPE
jgi:hypothetical protein